MIMDKETLFVALSNQKGGVGKSAFTILLASYFHYVENLNVAVIDCDSPQHSLVRMRERDKKAIDRSDHYKQQMMAQWERIKKKAYPIIGVRAEKAREAADELVKNIPSTWFWSICRVRWTRRACSVPLSIWIT